MYLLGQASQGSRIDAAPEPKGITANLAETSQGGRRQAAAGGGAAAAGQAQAEGQAAAALGGARFRADQNRTDGGFLHKVKLGEDWWEDLSAKLTHLYV